MKNKKVIIRKAIDSDFDWVVNLMNETLEPFYGGDHKAHAKRIFQTHIAGGHDQIGFFSFEQQMFIAEVNGVKAGMVHLVGKRQQTYKISPLIVTSEFKGRFGIGSQLLNYVETYARNNNARQIYCTVAEKNIAAMQFFLRKGFIKAGNSDSHYKSGVTEAMLYKSLYRTKEISSLDQMNISVLPFEDQYAKQISELLLQELPKSFEGISEEWVAALYDGYQRRHSADINAKYKLIYVALNNDKVIGVAAATPKKGNPIKIMPFVAINQVAFDALLTDLPYQLVAYGHKLYVHLNPTADEIMSLQRIGWKLDAVMPSAYRPNVTTQQWSINIGETTMRTMRVKKQFFDLIRSGRKDLEVRVGYNTIKRIQIGERINLATHNESCEIQILDIRHYKTFKEMLTEEPYNHISPDSKSADEVLSLFKKIYGPKKEKLGVIVFKLSLIK